MAKLDFSKLEVITRSADGIFRIPFKDWLARMGEDALSTPLGGTGNDTTLMYGDRPAEWRNGKIFLTGIAADNRGPSGKAYGFDVEQYNVNGDLEDSYFQPEQRSDGWLADNMETWGPMAVLGMAAMGSGGLFNSYMTPDAALALGNTNVAAMGSAGAEAAAFGPDWVTQAIAEAAGANPYGMPEYGSAGADTLFNDAAGYFAAPTPEAAIEALAGATTGSTGAVTGGGATTPTTPGSTAATGASTASTAAKLAAATGLPVADILKAITSGVMANQTVNTMKDATGEIGGLYDKALADLPVGLPTNTKPATFTPYNIKSDFSQYWNGVSSVDPVIQGLLSKSNKAAGASWDNVNNFDMQTASEQELADTMALLEPYQRQQQQQLESRMAAQGRLGLKQTSGMFDPAAGGAAPELNALYSAQQEQQLKAAQAARATALARRGELINQGTAAMNPMFTSWKNVQGDIDQANRVGLGMFTGDSDRYGRELAYLSDQARLRSDLNRTAIAAKAGNIANITDAQINRNAGYTNAASGLLGAAANWIFGNK